MELEGELGMTGIMEIGAAKGGGKGTRGLRKIVQHSESKHRGGDF